MRNHVAIAATYAAFAILATSASAGIQHPERFLSKDCAVYLRIDGFPAHKDAFAKTALSQLFKNELRPLMNDLGRRLQDELGPEQIKNSLLDGTSPIDLLALQSGAKQLSAFVGILVARGALIGIELESKPKYRYRSTFIFPDLDEPHRKIVFQGLRLVSRWLEFGELQPAKMHGRTVFTSESGDEDVSFWAEGHDVIFTFGHSALEKTMNVVRGKRPHLAQTDLFRRVAQFNEFETFARGIVRIKPTLAAWDETIVFSDKEYFLDSSSMEMQFGFAGNQLRRVLTFNVGDEETKKEDSATPDSSLPFASLPPVPKDADSVAIFPVTGRRFLSGMTKAFKFLLTVLDSEPESFDSAVKQMKQTIGEETLRRFVDALGSKVVTYHSPSHGPIILGKALALQVKNEPQLKANLHRVTQGIAKALEEFVEERVGIRKRKFRDAELVIFDINTSEVPVVITYVIHDGWFVIGLTPQVAMNFVELADQDPEPWKPSQRLLQSLEHTRRTQKDQLILVRQSNCRRDTRLLFSALPAVVAMVRETPATPGSFDVSLLPTANSVTRLLEEDTCTVVKSG